MKPMANSIYVADLKLEVVDMDRIFVEKLFITLVKPKNTDNEGSKY